MLEWFEVDLNSDQNFLLLDFNKDGSFWKYSVRLACINVLADLRSSRNFSQSLGDASRLARFLHLSFFERIRLTSPSIQGGELLLLNDFEAISWSKHLQAAPFTVRSSFSEHWWNGTEDSHMTVLNCSDYPDFRVVAARTDTCHCPFSRDWKWRRHIILCIQCTLHSTAHFHAIGNGGDILFCVSNAHCIECYFEGLTAIYRHIYRHMVIYIYRHIYIDISLYIDIWSDQLGKTS
jgi:hypothetical protein